MTRIIHFFASKLAYITQKHYFCVKIYSVNYGTQILSSLWSCVYLPTRKSRQVSMCRCIALSRHPCLYRRAIPQPMPLPQVFVGVLSLSTLWYCPECIRVFPASTPYTLHLTPKKIAPKSDFSCIYQKLVVPLHRIQSREAGAIPAQSRCCDSQSDVQILISHWFLANWEGWTKGAISQKTCCVPPTELVVEMVLTAP